MAAKKKGGHGTPGSYKRRIQHMEQGLLTSGATHSYSKKATLRELLEDLCDIRTPFQRDRDRIIHSKAFRRLMHKTQVFISPDSEHLRTRLTHSLEVMQIARTIARSIGANEDLVEAIALGHDLGHTPFGHKGEATVSECLKDNGFPSGFEHAGQSWRIVSYLEDYSRFPGGGLNLTAAVRFGILRHSGRYGDGSPEAVFKTRWGKDQKCNYPQSLEEKIVRVSDDIAWLNHDWDDGVRSGLLSNTYLGPDLVVGLGVQQPDRINAMVTDVYLTYRNRGRIEFSVRMSALKGQLRERIEKLLWNCDEVATYNREAEDIVRKLFYHFLEHWGDLPDKTRSLLGQAPSSASKYRALIVSDYISGMTDEYALRTYERYVYSPYSRFTNMKMNEAPSWIQPFASSRGLVYRDGAFEYFGIKKPDRLQMQGAERFGVFGLDQAQNGAERLGEQKAEVVYDGSRMRIVNRQGGTPISDTDVLVFLT